MEETITNTKPDFLTGGGKMGKLIRSKDWSKTPLGASDIWPQSLRTAVSLCIASNFPIDIVWGPHRVQIYNDGYWPITGDKHPASMGQDFKECWLSAWPVIGQAFEEASLGQARFLENQHIFLDRYGYKEETFFTFSFSPILDESGEVGGLFHPVIELTQQTLAERRLNILRSVADITVNARTVAEASSFIMECLEDFGQDLPFVLLYSIDADGKEANLQGNVGVEKDSPLATVKINLEVQHPDTWPLAEAIQNGKSIQVDDLGTIFGTFNCNPYPEPPCQAMIFPINLQGSEQHNYFLIAGVSSRRSLDEKYLSFYELLSASINNALTKAKAYEEERKKAEILAEIDKAKTVFFSNISHEFRTPLTLILSPLEELLNQKNNNFSEIEKENIETSHRNAIRLLKLVNTLLDFSRIESGRVKTIFSLVDIVVLTKNLASNFRSVIEKAGLELIVSADSIIQPVYVDKQMWEKIIFNLLSNAFKYTLAGKITVELLAENDFVVLKVKDTGVGIPENELPKMFERFHRVQNVTGRTYEGTGIGLSLIKELVQLHKGTINVESKLHGGSVFTVKIPTGKKHIDEHQISEMSIDLDEISSTIYVDEIASLLETEKPETLKITGVKGKNILPTILIVDDNADMREHISSILSNSYHVITANNGMDALHKMQETTPTLVLSDIMMPVMDGMGLLKEIKSNKATANIPVIFLTARAGEESRIEGWETGADDYLVKPFSSKELVSRIAQQIKIQKLRVDAEKQLQTVFNTTTVAIGVLEGPEHRYKLVNPVTCQMLHRTENELLGKTVKEVFPEAQDAIKLYDEVYNTGKSFAINELLVPLDLLNDGVVRPCYFNLSCDALTDSEDKINAIVVTAINVTEQVESRKKLEESEQKIRNFIAQAPVAMCLYKEPDFKVEIVNKKMLQLWGKGLETIINKPLFEAMPDVTGQGFEDLLHKVYSTGESYSADEVPINLLRNGTYEKIYVNLSYESYRESDGTITGIVEVANDVTEQVIARKRIEESEKRQAFLLKLSDTLRPLSNPVDIEEAVTKIAIDFMDADWCHYVTIEEDNLIIQRGASRDDFPSLAGVYPMSNFALFKELLNTGIPTIIDDVHTTNILDEDLKQLCIQLQNIAFVIVPVIKNGKLGGLLCLVQSEPRKWTESEVQLTVETAERTWAAVERAKTEESLKKSEEKYRTLFTSIDQGFALCELIRNQEGKGVDFYVLEVNPNYEKQAGVSIEMMTGKTILQLFPELDKWWIETYATVVDNQQPVEFEQYFEFAYRWFTIKAYPGENDRFVILFSDITERKQAEEKIKASEERFRSLAQTLPQLVWVTDNMGNLEFASARWKEYTGIEPGTENEWETIVHPDDYDRITAAWNECLKTGNIYKTEVRFKSKEGKYRWHAGIGEPVLDMENNIVKWVGAFTDIHEQKLKEEKKDEFISIASHEMKTPLTTSKAYLQMLELTLIENNEEALLYAKKASQSVNRLNVLIAELLDVSKIRLGKLNYTITTFNFNEMVDSTIENIQLLSPTYTIIKSGKVFGDLTGDKERLQQVVINLLSNAIKYSPQAKQVFVTVGQENDHIKVSVKDQGVGMTKDNLTKIFEKYHRNEEHAIQFQGLGIGLFISYEIIQRHQGKLWAESELGKGSTFYFTLPLSQMTS